MTTAPEDQSERLLPCPFCGHVGLDFSEGSTFRWLAYWCGNCGIGGEMRMQTLGEGTREEWRAAAERDARDTWNARAALRAPQTSAASPPTLEADYQGLPEPTMEDVPCESWGQNVVHPALYTAEQMREYARAAKVEAPAQDTDTSIEEVLELADAYADCAVRFRDEPRAALEAAIRRAVGRKNHAWQWEPSPAEALAEYDAAELIERRVDDAREAGADDARRGVQDVSAGFGDLPFFGCPEAWTEKPFARIVWFYDSGDPSVGQPAQAGWSLAEDQSGTVVGDIAARDAAAVDVLPIPLAVATSEAALLDCVRGGQSEDEARTTHRIAIRDYASACVRAAIKHPGDYPLRAPKVEAVTERMEEAAFQAFNQTQGFIWTKLRAALEAALSHPLPALAPLQVDNKPQG
jgi:hypothetical protein